MSFQALSHLLSYSIGEIDGDGIAYHLISYINIGIYKLKVVREALKPCTFTDRQPSVQFLLTRNKTANIWLHKLHLWRLRMKLALSP